MCESKEQQSFLLKLSDALRPLSNPIEIQEVAARILGEQMGVSHVAYGQVTDDDTYIVFEQNYVATGAHGNWPISNCRLWSKSSLRTG